MCEALTKLLMKPYSYIAVVTCKQRYDLPTHQSTDIMELLSVNLIACFHVRENRKKKNYNTFIFRKKYENCVARILYRGNLPFFNLFIIHLFILNFTFFLFIYFLFLFFCGSTPSSRPLNCESPPQIPQSCEKGTEKGRQGAIGYCLCVA